MMSLLMIWWVSCFWVLWCLRLMICGESHDSESYDVSVLWSVMSLMSLMICASYVGTKKSSMNDDKKDHDMDSASSADIALQDFLKDCGCNIHCITWGAMIGRVVWGAMIARVAFAEKYVMIMRSHVLRSVLSVLVLHNVFLFYLRVLALRHVSLMTNDQASLCMHTQLT